MSTSSSTATLTAARRLLAARLMRDGEDLDEVRLAAGVGWGVLLGWCFDDEGRRLVSADVLEELAHRADRASREHRARRQSREARQGRTSRDTDRAYRHLKEEVDGLKAEFQDFNGMPYTRGWDDELDAKIALLEHWYG